MKTQIKNVATLIRDGAQIPAKWNGKAVINDDNMTYVAWNEDSKEAIVVDPMRDDWDALISLTRQELASYRFVAVIDTHTHADHISCASDLANAVKAPLIQHVASPSRRIQLRIALDTFISTAAGPLQFLVTPGHTPEYITPIWGPFLFGGDLLLYGDTGRDDLPGGDAGAHWESLQKIKANATPDLIVLPGHDDEGGRASSLKTQLELCPGLNQDKETFIRDAGSYVGPSPKLLKESLYENFK